MQNYRWIGQFRNGSGSRIVTLKLHVMCKRFAEASIETKVNSMLVEGWTLLKEQLFPTDCKGHPLLRKEAM